MGGAAWRRLHRLVYRVAILAAPHFVWLAKAVRWMWWRGGESIGKNGREGWREEPPGPHPANSLQGAPEI